MGDLTSFRPPETCGPMYRRNRLVILCVHVLESILRIGICNLRYEIVMFVRMLKCKVTYTYSLKYMGQL